MNSLIVSDLITVTRNPQLFIEITMSQHTKNPGSHVFTTASGQDKLDDNTDPKEV